ncbi:MAG: hypothetical protein J6J27_05625 [Alphaproteobacteria bacterium]|nr:hypothetical protein [Alphaproteobacteria bacterium]
MKSNKELLKQILKNNPQISIEDLKKIQIVLKNNVFLEKKQYDIGIPPVDNRNNKQQTITNVYCKNY